MHNDIINIVKMRELEEFIGGLNFELYIILTSIFSKALPYYLFPIDLFFHD